MIYPIIGENENFYLPNRIDLKAMIWKLLSTTFFILLSIQNTYAYKTISYQPIVKYNYSKSHYLVSLPVNKDSWNGNGFTAVFDSKTHQLTFKIPRYFCDGFIFLSNDGTKLIHFDSKEDSLDKHLTLFFHLYDQNGESKSTIFLMKKKKHVFGKEFMISGRKRTN